MGIVLHVFEDSTRNIHRWQNLSRFEAERPEIDMNGRTWKAAVPAVPLKAEIVTPVLESRELPNSSSIFELASLGLSLA